MTTANTKTGAAVRVVLPGQSLTWSADLAMYAADPVAKTKAAVTVDGYVLFLNGDMPQPEMTLKLGGVWDKEKTKVAIAGMEYVAVSSGGFICMAKRIGDGWMMATARLKPPLTVAELAWKDGKLTAKDSKAGTHIAWYGLTLCWPQKSAWRGKI